MEYSVPNLALKLSQVTFYKYRLPVVSLERSSIFRNCSFVYSLHSHCRVILFYSLAVSPIVSFQFLYNLHSPEMEVFGNSSRVQISLENCLSQHLQNSSKIFFLDSREFVGRFLEKKKQHFTINGCSIRHRWDILTHKKHYYEKSQRKLIKFCF